MRDFERYLKQQASCHPSMRPADVVKLCFQAVFGAAHILGCEQKTLSAIEQEYENVPAKRIALFERISARFARCNIAAYKHHLLPPEWLNSMLHAQNETANDGTESDFREHLAVISACAESGLFGFDATAWSEFVEKYLADGIRPIHHSAQYKAAENPSYRVVSSDYERVRPILLKAARIPQTGSPRVISIDGRAASGKTTVARLLASVLKAEVVHMDDFFLPSELRTPSRLAESGGNVHYERFASEVLGGLRRNEAFAHKIFDCGPMEFTKTRTIQKSEWRIVEGAYSRHRAFGDYADLYVFCDVSPEAQIKRIIKRNGESMAKEFRERWIPLEERYLATENVKQRADVVLL